MTILDTGLPSTRQIQALIKDKKEVQVKLNTEELLVGKILWQDANCICLSEKGMDPTLIWRQALTYLRPTE